MTTPNPNPRKVKQRSEPIWSLMGLLFQSHPWHGVPIGENAPDRVTAYVEMVPTDTVKYELEKVSGLLKLDRPQQYSNICPALYGFLPQTYCGQQIGKFCSSKTGRPDIIGDGDPLDICILTEREISHGNILVDAIPIGGLRLIDGTEADDKIIAVLHGDAAYGHWRDLAEVPTPILERLRHYFLTYKNPPGTREDVCELLGVYGRDEAHEVIHTSQQDYEAHFAGIESLMSAALRG